MNIQRKELRTLRPLKIKKPKSFNKRKLTLPKLKNSVKRLPMKF